MTEAILYTCGVALSLFAVLPMCVLFMFIIGD